MLSRRKDETVVRRYLNLNAFYNNKKKINKKVRVSTELGTYIHIYIQTKANKEDKFDYI